LSWKQSKIYTEFERVSDCYLAPTQQCFSYVMARTCWIVHCTSNWVRQKEMIV